MIPRKIQLIRTSVPRAARKPGPQAEPPLVGLQFVPLEQRGPQAAKSLGPPGPQAARSLGPRGPLAARSLGPRVPLAGQLVLGARSEKRGWVNCVRNSCVDVSRKIVVF